MTMMSRGSTPAFIGRVQELSALIDAFEAARAGRATTALVGGEAGVGKSRLVRELGAYARRSGARVLVGHCLDLEEGGLPYAPFVDILRTLERELPADEGGAAIGPLRTALGSPPGEASPEPPPSAVAPAPRPLVPVKEPGVRAGCPSPDPGSRARYRGAGQGARGDRWGRRTAVRRTWPA